LITIVALDLLRVLSLLANRRRLATSVLKPIDEMAQAARNLSASNLDMRINILGTKNELRDLASVINDMLDRIETAYESQKSFVSDASHELRTPISVIRGYAQLLERWGMSDPEVAKEAISAISSEAESMRELVEKLLFLARHDKKTFKLEMETFDLTELCREMIRDTQLIAKDHNVQQGQMQNVAVIADRSAVKQAIRVFIDNAIKYTPKGGTITISCEDLGDDARISVTDSGPGMTRDEVLRAFDRFYRSDSARRSQVAGHGLGLSIARLIAASHGGKISVKTAPGEGSTFRLILKK
jgi:two-component system sensor histidine kinase ArlS